MITNPQLMNSQLSFSSLVDMVRQVKHLWLPITCSILSSIFGSFYFLATRRIGQQVHASVKTMYLGIIGLVVSFVVLLVKRPSFFEFWKP